MPVVRGDGQGKGSTVSYCKGSQSFMGVLLNPLLSKGVVQQHLHLGAFLASSETLLIPRFRSTFWAR